MISEVPFDYDAKSLYRTTMMGHSPAGYWRLNELSGITADDQTTNNNDGTYAPGDPWSGGSLGQPGALADDPATSADFNGSTGHVDVGNVAALRITGNLLTLAAWVKTTDTDGMIAVKADGSDLGYGLRINSGKARGFLSTTTVATVDSSANVNDGAWHFLVFTYDGANMRIFVDGSEAGTSTAHTGNIDPTTEPFWIAERSATPQTRLDGQIQEVSALSTALTPAQIKELYEIGTGLITGPKGNGNLADDGVRIYQWDALNRLKTVADKSTGNIVGQYEYDALGRRIRKTISNGGLSGNITDDTIDYIYRGAQCVEERNSSNAATKQYVWGRYIDELIQQKHLVTINGHAAGDYYLLSDLLYRAVALTNSSGTIIEAYDTDAYGNTLIFDAVGTGSDWWADDATQTDEPTCDYIFTGRRLDPETKIYFYRGRYYDMDRFISRDPIGYRAGMNLYGFVGGRATVALDPTGTEEGAWSNFIYTYENSSQVGYSQMPSVGYYGGVGSPGSAPFSLTPSQLQELGLPSESDFYMPEPDAILSPPWTYDSNSQGNFVFRPNLIGAGIDESALPDVPIFPLYVAERDIYNAEGFESLTNHADIVAGCKYVVQRLRDGGGPEVPNSEGQFTVNFVTPDLYHTFYRLIRAKHGVLKYGATGVGTSCDKVTEAQIVSCIRLHPKEEKPKHSIPGIGTSFVKNCQTDCENTLYDCCLFGYRGSSINPARVRRVR